jgi:hypothetical protein
VTIDISPGALPSDTTISITNVLPTDPNLDFWVGDDLWPGFTVATHDLRPEGLLLNIPATLTIVRDVSALTEVQRSGLGIFVFSDTLQAYEDLGSTCDSAENPPGVFTATCWASLDHFSMYAMIVPRNRPPVPEALVEQATAVGQTGTVRLDGSGSYDPDHPASLLTLR